MQASTYQLLLPPVQNNWMWTDDAVLLTTLVAYKWQYLSAWGVNTQVAVSLGAEAATVLHEHNAHGLLLLHLSNDQTELRLTLTRPAHLPQTVAFGLSVPDQCLALPLGVLQALANSAVDWLASRLDTPLCHSAAQLPVVPSLAMLQWLAQWQQAPLPSAVVPTGVTDPLLTQLEDWLTQHPDLHLLYRLKASWLSQKRQFAESIRYYQTAITHTPDTLFWLRAKDATQAGLSAMFAGQQHIAQRWLEAAVTWAPSLPSPHLHLGLTYELLDNTEAAIQHLQVYQQLKPDDARTLYSLVRLFSQQEQWANAVQAYTELMVLVPPDSWMRCDLGIAHLHLGQLDQARHWFEQVLDTEPAGHPAVDMAQLMLGSVGSRGFAT
jgi:tetratricopeptide (TPR) repeat protein